MFEKERQFQIFHEVVASKFRVVILTHLYYDFDVFFELLKEKYFVTNDIELSHHI